MFDGDFHKYVTSVATIWSAAGKALLALNSIETATFLGIPPFSFPPRSSPTSC